MYRELPEGSSRQNASGTFVVDLEGFEPATSSMPFIRVRCEATESYQVYRNSGDRPVWQRFPFSSIAPYHWVTLGQLSPFVWTSMWTSVS